MAHGYPDYEGDKSGLYLKPEWAAKEGADKNLYTYGLDVAVGDFIVASYTIPTGKTLYVCGASFSIVAAAAANRNNNQIGLFELYNYTDSITLARLGGNGGGSMSFPKPIPISAGKLLQYYVYNWSNQIVHLALSFYGYEA